MDFSTLPSREELSCQLSQILQISASVNLAEERKTPKLCAETTWDFEMWFSSLSSYAARVQSGQLIYILKNIFLWLSLWLLILFILQLCWLTIYSILFSSLIQFGSMSINFSIYQLQSDCDLIFICPCRVIKNKNCAQKTIFFAAIDTKPMYRPVKPESPSLPNVLVYKLSYHSIQKFNDYYTEKIKNNNND